MEPDVMHKISDQLNAVEQYYQGSSNVCIITGNGDSVYVVCHFIDFYPLFLSER